METYYNNEYINNNENVNDNDNDNENVNKNENVNSAINIRVSEQWRQNYLDYYDVESNTFYSPIVIDNSNLNYRNTKYSNIVTGYIKTEKDPIEDMKRIRKEYLKGRLCSNCNNCIIL